jgi:hypothetical protein
MSLTLQFNYRVEEAATQMNLFLKPAGETAAKLPRDFAISAGYSKGYSDEKILGIIAPAILETLAENKTGYDGTLEFTRDDGHVVALKQAP